MDNKNKKMPKNIYFKIIERNLLNPNGRKWKLLVDKTGSIWGVFYTYRAAKGAIRSLRIRYGKTLRERGTFSLEEIKDK